MRVILGTGEIGRGSLIEDDPVSVSTAKWERDRPGECSLNG